MAKFIRLGRIRARDRDLRMSGNPNPPADGKSGVDRLSAHHIQNPAVEHQDFRVQMEDRVGELIAAADAQALQDYHDAGHSSGSGGHGMDEDGVGVVENEGMEAEGPSDPSHLGDPQAMVAPQAGTNQLTLSFQGEVYVFDSVSPEKVTFF